MNQITKIIVSIFTFIIFISISAGYSTDLECNSDAFKSETDNDGLNDFNDRKSTENNNRYSLPIEEIKSLIYLYVIISVFLVLTFVTTNKIKQNKINLETEQKKMVRQVFEVELEKQYAEKADKISSGNPIIGFLKVAVVVFTLGIIIKSIYLIFSSMLILLLGAFLSDTGKANNTYILKKCTEDALKITAAKTADRELQHFIKNQKKREVQFTIIVIILCVAVMLVVYKLLL